MTLILSILVSLNLFAGRCAKRLNPENVASNYSRASDYLKEVVKAGALAHGISARSATKVIRNQVLLSAWDLGLEGGNFTHTNPAPLKSVFTQVMQDIGSIENYGYADDQAQSENAAKVFFEVVFLFKPEIVDHYPSYAARGWNYDRNMNCITSDIDLQMASFSQLITPRATDPKENYFADPNEISFRQPLGVSLAHLMGIHVRDAANIPRIREALLNAGVSAKNIAQLFNWRKNWPQSGYQSNELLKPFPPKNITAEKAHSIYRAIKGSKVMWKDFDSHSDLVHQFYVVDAQNQFVNKLTKILKTNSEILVNAQVIGRFRIPMKEVKLNTAEEKIEYINVDSGKAASLYFSDVIEVGEMSQLRARGVLN